MHFKPKKTVQPYSHPVWRTFQSRFLIRKQSTNKAVSSSGMATFPPLLFIYVKCQRRNFSHLSLTTDIDYHLQAPDSESSESSKGDNTPTFTLYPERLHTQATKATQENVCQYRMSSKAKFRGTCKRSAAPNLSRIN